MTLNYNDPAFAEPTDPRSKILIDLLSRTIFGSEVSVILEQAGLNPGLYDFKSAQLVWTAAVPDASREGRLAAMLSAVTQTKPAFDTELAKRLANVQLLSHQARWYRHEEPHLCKCMFVGLRSSRAIIDRKALRQGLSLLAADEYWVLIVHGKPRSGKSHTWLLIDHLLKTGGLPGMHTVARVTTHQWSGLVTGEDLAQSLVAKLGLTSIDLAPSQEMDDARVRKYLDRLVGAYPHDGKIRWIIVDGLDRPGVGEGARDLARGLIRLVEEGELPQTRLIVTGLDPLGLQMGNAVRMEEIPVIDRKLLGDFVREAAEVCRMQVTDEAVGKILDEILGVEPVSRDLADVEKTLTGIVTDRWLANAHDHE